MFGKKEKNDTPIAIDETNGVSNGGSTSFFGVKGAQIVGGSDYHNGILLMVFWDILAILTL